MAYSPVIYDWRSDLIPNSQVFIAGGQSVQGGMTLGGFLTENPEPGGRATLSMSFSTLKKASNLNASWTYSRIMNGNLMRIPVYFTDQLVPYSDLDNADFENGIPWSAGQPWGNGENWAYSPSAPIVFLAAKGADRFSVRLSDLGDILKIGHVIGFYLGGYDFAHIVMDIDYDSDGVGTVKIQPPLRRELTTDDVMLFRPKMIVKCINAAAFASSFRLGRYTKPGDAQFVEAMV